MTHPLTQVVNKAEKKKKRVQVNDHFDKSPKTDALNVSLKKIETISIELESFTRAR